MYQLIQDVAKFRSYCEQYNMDFYPELYRREITIQYLTDTDM